MHPAETLHSVATSRRAPGRAVFASAALIACALLSACGGAEARRDRYIEKASALMADEDWDKAQLELRNALQIDPNDNVARVKLASVSEKLGDLRAAAQQYRSVIDADTKNVPARAGLARLYALGGLPEEAMKLANEGLALAPEDAGLLTARAAAKAQTGDVPGALADAERAFRNDPHSRNAAAVLASLYQRTDRPAEAMRIIDQAIREYPKDADFYAVRAIMKETAADRAGAAADYAALVALDPANFSRRMLQVRFLLRGDDVDGAEQALRSAIAATPDKIEPKLALAGLLASKRDFAAGEKSLLQLVDQSPADIELLVGLGDFYTGHGKASQAVATYRKAIELDGTGPQGLVARNRLAAASLKAGDRGTAAKLVAEVLAENAQDGDALALNAQLALDKGDAAAAIADLRALLRNKPDSIPAQRALAQAYLANNDMVLAEQTLKTALQGAPGNVQLQLAYAQMLLQGGKTAQAVAELEQVVAREPANLTAQETLFRLQGATRDFDAAMQTAAHVKAASPESGFGDYLEGLAFSMQGKPGPAVDAFDRVLQLQPGAAEPLTAAVQVLVGAGKPDAAMQRVERAIAARPDNLHAVNLKGEVLLAQKRYDAASAVFDDALRRAPQWWLPYRGKAMTNLLRGDETAAIATYEKGIAATNSADLLVDLAALHESKGRIDAAIATYETYLQRNPAAAIAANNLAMLLVSRRSDAPSIARAGELAKPLERSGSANFINTAGWVRLKAGDAKGAVPLLERAAHMRADSPQLLYMLGVAQDAAGQPVEARKSLESALALSTSFAGADEARATLDRLRRS
jgi:tetratricopeptide (TPR) repeat protein